jgi:large subunit ribosomal protein L1
MPNPKVGTVTVDVEKAVKSAKSGEVQFKVEKSGVVQAGLGKVSFDKQKISENITAFIESVNKAKPAGAKGSYLKRISLSSTMGPSVTLDSSQFAS